MNGKATGYAAFYLRLAIGAAFLSAVADRFGIWGPPGTPLVAWGNFHRFLLETAKINPWFPHTWIHTVGWVATACETIFGIALIVGFRTRIAAFLSGCLTLAFAIGMTSAMGIKAPLNFSVFTVSAASFLLSTVKIFPWSIDGKGRS